MLQESDCTDADVAQGPFLGYSCAVCMFLSDVGIITFG